MKPTIRYYDRASGRVETERVYAGPFLDWSYNTALGHALTGVLYRHRVASWLYGALNRLPVSRRRILPFIERMNVRTDDLLQPPGSFRNFSEFFTRSIDTTRRRIDTDPSVCVAPCDGKVLAYERVRPGQVFSVKRHSFELGSLLRDAGLARYYDDGSMVISRLALADYHHFHFPDSGVPSAAVSIPGRYHAGGPYSLTRLLPYYGENYRMMTLLESDNFGRIACVEVGAFTVGSIRQSFRPGCRVAKGGEKGYFELGGSTVVLLFHRGAIRLDADLVANTRRDLETYVSFGDSIGRT